MPLSFRFSRQRKSAGPDPQRSVDLEEDEVDHLLALRASFLSRGLRVPEEELGPVLLCGGSSRERARTRSRFSDDHLRRTLGQGFLRQFCDEDVPESVLRAERDAIERIASRDESLMGEAAVGDEYGAYSESVGGRAAGSSLVPATAACASAHSDTVYIGDENGILHVCEAADLGHLQSIPLLQDPDPAQRDPIRTILDLGTHVALLQRGVAVLQARTGELEAQYRPYAEEPLTDTFPVSAAEIPIVMNSPEDLPVEFFAGVVARGLMFCGTTNGSIHVIDAGGSLHAVFPHALSTKHLHPSSIIAGERDTVWACAGSAVNVYSALTLEQIAERSLPADLGTSSARFLYALRDGSVVCCTRKGMAVWRPRDASALVFTGVRVPATIVAEEGDGVLVCVDDEGVFRTVLMDEAEPHVCPAAQNTSKHRILYAASLGRGQVLYSTHRGLLLCVEPAFPPSCALCAARWRPHSDAQHGGRACRDEIVRNGAAGGGPGTAATAAAGNGHAAPPVRDEDPSRSTATTNSSCGGESADSGESRRRRRRRSSSSSSSCRCRADEIVALSLPPRAVPRIAPFPEYHCWSTAGVRKKLAAHRALRIVDIEGPEASMRPPSLPTRASSIGAARQMTVSRWSEICAYLQHLATPLAVVSDGGCVGGWSGLCAAFAEALYGSTAYAGALDAALARSTDPPGAAASARRPPSILSASSLTSLSSAEFLCAVVEEAAGISGVRTILLVVSVDGKVAAIAHGDPGGSAAVVLMVEGEGFAALEAHASAAVVEVPCAHPDARRESARASRASSSSRAAASSVDADVRDDNADADAASVVETAGFVCTSAGHRALRIRGAFASLSATNTHYVARDASGGVFVWEQEDAELNLQVLPLQSDRPSTCDDAKSSVSTTTPRKIPERVPETSSAAASSETGSDSTELRSDRSKSDTLLDAASADHTAGAAAAPRYSDSTSSPSAVRRIRFDESEEDRDASAEELHTDKRVSSSSLSSLASGAAAGSELRPAPRDAARPGRAIATPSPIRLIACSCTHVYMADEAGHVWRWRDGCVLETVWHGERVVSLAAGRAHAALATANGLAAHCRDTDRAFRALPSAATQLRIWLVRCAGDTTVLAGQRQAFRCTAGAPGADGSGASLLGSASTGIVDAFASEDGAGYVSGDGEVWWCAREERQARRVPAYAYGRARRAVRYAAGLAVLADATAAASNGSMVGRLLGAAPRIERPLGIERCADGERLCVLALGECAERDHVLIDKLYELISTECSYVSKLRILAEVYARRADVVCGDEPRSIELMRALCANVTRMLDVHSRLIMAVRRAAYQTLPLRDMKIGEFFHKFAVDEFQALYGGILDTVEQRSDMLGEIEQLPLLAMALADAERELRAELRQSRACDAPPLFFFQALIMEPVPQRVTRYAQLHFPHLCDAGYPAEDRAAFREAARVLAGAMDKVSLVLPEAMARFARAKDQCSAAQRRALAPYPADEFIALYPLARVSWKRTEPLYDYLSSSVESQLWMPWPIACARCGEEEVLFPTRYVGQCPNRIAYVCYACRHVEGQEIEGVGLARAGQPYLARVGSAAAGADRRSAAASALAPSPCPSSSSTTALSRADSAVGAVREEVAARAGVLAIFERLVVVVAEHRGAVAIPVALAWPHLRAHDPPAQCEIIGPTETVHIAVRGGPAALTALLAAVLERIVASAGPAARLRAGRAVSVPPPGEHARSTESDARSNGGGGACWSCLRRALDQWPLAARAVVATDARPAPVLAPLRTTTTTTTTAAAAEDAQHVQRRDALDGARALLGDVLAPRCAPGEHAAAPARDAAWMGGGARREWALGAWAQRARPWPLGRWVRTGALVRGDACGVWAIRSGAGDAFVGALRHGRAHGFGVLAAHRDEAYAGRFHEGLRHGWGVQRYSGVGGGALLYSGAHARGKRHGVGALLRPGGEIVVGAWESGRPHGYAEVVFAAETAGGEAQLRALSGSAVLRAAFAEHTARAWSPMRVPAAYARAYMGRFLRGVRQGLGLLLFRSGVTYFGGFERDQPDGLGCLVQRAHTDEPMLYVGHFVRGKMHGRGVQVLSDNDLVVQGEYEDGERHGWSCVIERDGTAFHGTFRKNSRRGAGILQMPNGDAVVGTWSTDDRGSDIVQRGVHIRASRTTAQKWEIAFKMDSAFVRSVKSSMSRLLQRHATVLETLHQKHDHIAMVLHILFSRGTPVSDLSPGDHAGNEEVRASIAADISSELERKHRQFVEFAARQYSTVMVDRLSTIFGTEASVNVLKNQFARDVESFATFLSERIAEAVPLYSPDDTGAIRDLYLRSAFVRAMDDRLLDVFLQQLKEMCGVNG